MFTYRLMCWSFIVLGLVTFADILPRSLMSGVSHVSPGVIAARRKKEDMVQLTRSDTINLNKITDFCGNILNNKCTTQKNIYLFTDILTWPDPYGIFGADASLKKTVLISPLIGEIIWRYCSNCNRPTLAANIGKLIYRSGPNYNADIFRGAPINQPAHSLVLRGWFCLDWCFLCLASYMRPLVQPNTNGVSSVRKFYAKRVEEICYFRAACPFIAERTMK